MDDYLHTIICEKNLIGEWHAIGEHRLRSSSLRLKEVKEMSKEQIMKALKDAELRKKLLDELEVEELEERVATRHMCYMPVP